MARTSFRDLRTLLPAFGGGADQPEFQVALSFRRGDARGLPPPHRRFPVRLPAVPGRILQRGQAGRLTESLRTTISGLLAGREGLPPPASADYYQSR